MDGGVDYQYNKLYDDYDNEDDADDMEDTEVEIEDISLENMPPPGLASIGAEGIIRDPHRDPPEYMMDLYNRFSASKPYIHPTSNIVRSFMNVNQEGRCHLSVYLYNSVHQTGICHTSSGTSV